LDVEEQEFDQWCYLEENCAWWSMYCTTLIAIWLLVCDHS